MEKPEKSKELPADEAAEAVTEVLTTAEVEEFTAGDERKTVQAAVEARVEELATAAGVVSTAEVLAQDAGVIRVDPLHPDPARLPAEPLAAGANGRVRVRWPVTEFHHGVDGVPAITAEGVEVSSDKVDELLSAARSAGTDLEAL